MKTGAVIIAYNPDAGFAQRIEAIVRETRYVWIIDNGSMQPPRLKSTQLISLGQNMGIAHAQNVGLDLAFSAGCDGVILFDHDSVPQQGFTPALWTSYTENGARCIVGARIFDRNTREFAKHPVRQGLFFKRASSDLPITNALLAIASGTLITRKIFEAVGRMRADFFIDYVDWEYCLRAYHVFNIPTVISPNAILEHARGVRKPRKFLWFVIHPPGYSEMRYGHIFTNRSRLLRQYWRRDRAFVGFEAVTMVRDLLLIPFENGGWRKLVLALRSWLYGLFKA